MKKFAFLYILAAALLFSSCKGGKAGANDESDRAEAKGGRIYGGCLRLSDSEPFNTLYPNAIVDVTSGFVATQLFDGLTKLNNSSLKAEPCIADKWDIDASGTKYIFHLKKGVMFQDDECFSGGTGREVKAGDFKYSFELLCKNTPDNNGFKATFMDRVKGANNYFDGKGELEGVKVLDDYTLEVTLEHPSTVFLQILAQPVCAVLAKEAVDKYGKDIKTGAGAFMYDAAKSSEDVLFLKRNPNYHGIDSLGNRLPFLDSVIVTYIPSKEDELTMFKEGKTDMITSLPARSIREMVENKIQDFQGHPPKYLLDNSPEIITQYYSFNTSRPPYDNPKVRKAFNMAINRKKIVEDILNNQAYGPATNGFVPPVFPGYDIKKIKGYEYNVAEAKKLLAEAGYPNGRAFPITKIILNSGGARNTNVVVEIQKELLENLNINVDFEVLSLAKKIEQSKMGQGDIYREAWVADYPSPESFLNVLYGGDVPKDPAQPSYPNTSRYKNPQYDLYFNLGKDAKNRDSSFAYFARAEQILMDDAPIMPIWYDGTYRLTRNGIKNAGPNSMRYRNLSEVYLNNDFKNPLNEPQDTLK